MPLPINKNELLENLKLAYEKLDNEFDSIAPESERICGLEGNVSCCDIIAYQIGWGKLLLGWEKDEQSGKLPHMPALDFKWNQLGELAQTFYKENSKKSLAQLRIEFEIIYQELIKLINSAPEIEIFQPFQRQWTGEKWAMVKWIQVNTIAPYKSARTKVRRWKRE